MSKAIYSWHQQMLDCKLVLGCLKSLLSATKNLLIEQDLHLISKSINSCTSRSKLLVKDRIYSLVIIQATCF